MIGVAEALQLLENLRCEFDANVVRAEFETAHSHVVLEATRDDRAVIHDGTRVELEAT